ncbi:DUF6678 family protein [Bradyrhizobium sp.]|uniref:DUF6678 family protein n=1 Tax=Bradyrhizobium sp. TaxID=376 RepID=UPI00345B62D3
MAQKSDYFSVANDTKWRELRKAILELDCAEWPSFRCKSLDTGHLSSWDGEWYYHWSEGGWDWMEWAELSVRTPQERDTLREILRLIRFAGVETADGFRIYGYIRRGEVADYIK